MYEKKKVGGGVDLDTRRRLSSSKKYWASCFTSFVLSFFLVSSRLIHLNWNTTPTKTVECCRAMATFSLVLLITFPQIFFSWCKKKKTKKRKFININLKFLRMKWITSFLLVDNKKKGLFLAVEKMKKDIFKRACKSTTKKVTFLYSLFFFFFLSKHVNY